MRCLALAPLLVLAACGGEEAAADDRPTFAFVTNGQYSFWEPARAGVARAEEDFGVRVLFQMPEATLPGQKQVLEDVLNRGIDGLAVSVIDPENQTPLIDRFAGRVPVITHDADAPESARRMFIGVDNRAAGRMLGELVARTLPEGGKVALFIGNLSQANARDRRQGVVDVLEEAGGTFTIVDTYTDDADRAKAKANAEDVLNVHPDLAAMVGLFVHNPPACVQALRSQDALDDVRVFGFDEDAATLRAIAGGHVVGTVVQNPYQYGYQSIRALDHLHRGDEGVIPGDGFQEIPARLITRENLDAFRAELAGQMSVLENR